MTVFECLNLEETIVAGIDDEFYDDECNTLTPDQMRQQAALARLGRMLSRTEDATQVLDKATALAASALGVDRFGVARLRGDGQTTAFRFSATASSERDRVCMDHKLSLDPNSSSAAMAIDTNRPVAVFDLAEEDRFHDAVLQRHNVVSALVCPLSHNDRLFGAIGVYSTELHQFDCLEGVFLAEVARQLGAAIARQLNKSSLDQQARYLGAVELSSTCYMLTLSPDGAIVRFNGLCREKFGFDLDEIRDRHFWSAYLSPRDVPSAKEAFNQLRQGKLLAEFETSILTKHGDERRVAWSFAPQHSDDRGLEALIGTGIDVTELHEVKERNQRLEENAEETQAALHKLKEHIQGNPRQAAVSEQRPPGLKQDRRSRRRCPFPYKQTIAPLIEGKLPPLRAYYEVRCQDISPGGFAFLSEEPPEYEEYVAAFGVPPQRIYLTAKVAHVSNIEVDGQLMYKVGCKYTGRVSY